MVSQVTIRIDTSVLVLCNTSRTINTVKRPLETKNNLKRKEEKKYKGEKGYGTEAKWARTELPIRSRERDGLGVDVGLRLQTHAASVCARFLFVHTIFF